MKTKVLKFFVLLVVVFLVLTACEKTASVKPNPTPSGTPQIMQDIVATQTATMAMPTAELTSEEWVCPSSFSEAMTAALSMDKEDLSAMSEYCNNQTSPEGQIVQESTLASDQETSTKPFISPVECTKSFNTESSWIVCEPGVLLDASTAWTIPGTKDTWYSNVPEGAFTYYSLGQGKITVDDYTLDLSYKEGHNYLVLIRGRIDDGKVDTDRNLTAEVTNFVPGHAIWSHMPAGAYVSMNWFMQQLVASTTSGFTNCGALGCSHVTVVLFDVDTHFEQRFAVQSSDLSTWAQVK